MKWWLSFWELPAYYLDLYRAWPRAVLIGCAWQTWRVTDWYMALHDPSVAQSGFVSVVYAAVPWILSFYMQNGIAWDAKRQPSVAAAAPMTVTASITGEQK